MGDLGRAATRAVRWTARGIGLALAHTGIAICARFPSDEQLRLAVAAGEMTRQAAERRSGRALEIGPEYWHMPIRPGFCPPLRAVYDAEVVTVAPIAGSDALALRIATENVEYSFRIGQRSIDFLIYCLAEFAVGWQVERANGEVVLRAAVSAPETLAR